MKVNSVEPVVFPVKFDDFRSSVLGHRKSELRSFCRRRHDVDRAGSDDRIDPQTDGCRRISGAGRFEELIDQFHFVFVVKVDHNSGFDGAFQFRSVAMILVENY